MRTAVVLSGVRIGCLFLMGSVTKVRAQEPKLFRIAEIEVAPAQLDAYKAELRKEIEASIRMEPGVLALYAVAVKNSPNQIRLFEIYRGEEAYRAHLQSAHFRRYKAATVGMVKRLNLLETDPIALGSR